MKKIYLPLILIIFALFNVHAQKTDPVLGKLEYTLKIAFANQTATDTVKKYYSKNYSLYFGKNSSLNIEELRTSTFLPPRLVSNNKKDTVVIDEKKAKGDPALEALLKKTRDQNASASIMKTSSFRKYNSQIVHRLQQYENLAVITNDTIPKIEWDLTEEEKTISGYPVNKAIGMYKGRKYTAWYSKKIPTLAGPWQLFGLPGLIIEAYDDKKEIVIELVALTIPATEPILIRKPIAKGKVVSREEFLALQTKEIEKTQKMMKAENGNNVSNKQTLKLVNIEIK